jgi:N-acetylglucosaminyldiphosphoundecaprenol N-acetyl-beta-D-mannosaminyltransferase
MDITLHDSGPSVFHVLGVPISATTPEDAVARLIAWSRDNEGRLVCIRDVHGVMLARNDAELRAIHDEAALVTPDGMPLALLGQWRGMKVARTCGPDLMLNTLASSRATGLRHFFYGGRDGVAQGLAGRMSERFPGLEIVARETPPFRDLTDAEVAALANRIRESGAHIVWVGLSTPKQERLMRRLRPQVPATLIGVGAAFDIHAGLIRRAPQWMQRLSLEGVYRLLKEPRRLWRRYLVLAPKFVVLAAAEQVSGRWKAPAG